MKDTDKALKLEANFQNSELKLRITYNFLRKRKFWEIFIRRVRFLSNKGVYIKGSNAGLRCETAHSEKISIIR